MAVAARVTISALRNTCCGCENLRMNLRVVTCLLCSYRLPTPKRLRVHWESLKSTWELTVASVPALLCCASRGVTLLYLPGGARMWTAERAPLSSSRKSAVEIFTAESSAGAWVLTCVSVSLSFPLYNLGLGRPIPPRVSCLAHKCLHIWNGCSDSIPKIFTKVNEMSPKWRTLSSLEKLQLSPRYMWHNKKFFKKTELVLCETTSFNDKNKVCHGV